MSRVHGVVTWHVPLEPSSVWSSESRSNKLDLSSGLFAFSRLVVSQVPQGGAAFLPNLACTFMSRLLILRVSQTKAQSKPFTQPTCERVVSETSCWSSSLSAGMRSVSPAPSMHQSYVLLTTNLPGCISDSGDTCDNVLALVCVQSRWGETSSPETNFEVSLCIEPGQELDLNPRPLRFSPLLSRALTTQGVRADQAKVPQVGPGQPGAQGVREASIAKAGQGAIGQVREASTAEAGQGAIGQVREASIAKARSEMFEQTANQIRSLEPGGVPSAGAMPSDDPSLDSLRFNPRLDLCLVIPNP